MSGPSQPQNPVLGSIRTELLVGLIFAILAMLGFIIVAIIYFADVALVSSMAPYGAPAAAVGVLVGFGIVFLIMFAISIIVTIRIYRMYKAANSGDVAALKAMNSLGWAIVALIFSGLIPGIMLLIAHGPIQQLQ
ncbi:hypothetical protein GCM10007981_04930 [Thermocladium modestius]|uniref:Uncharacterized protein n=1 Tax=Thermocladium modestius TaxID=62609 RepID=A0A830GWP5_9CREN|nr:hypothetical protein [Thermocladium modestius]GGP19797.1 hypothetical protein GCM10007981_04930 [Thermocladium modestius]